MQNSCNFLIFDYNVKKGRTMRCEKRIRFFMKIKLKDIASALNLSPTTVSRALRSHPAISEETRQAVFQEAEKQGYQVSYTHRGRKLHSESAALNLLALVSGNESNDSNIRNASGVTHETLKGISDVVNCFHARLIIDFVQPSRLSQEEILEKCEAFDGIVFLHHFEESQVRAVSLRKPCVSADYAYPSAKADVVSGGDIDQFLFLIRHLRKLGHTRIGYLDFPHGHHPRGLRGYLGFRGGLMEAGLPDLPALHLLNTAFRNEKEKMEQALALTKRGELDVWVCGNDYAAMDLLELFSSHGISVPEDISVTGFGGIPFPGTNLRLCTFRTPFEQIGQEAAKYLFDRIRFPGIPVRHALVDCVFMEGNSVKCLKQKHS